MTNDSHGREFDLIARHFRPLAAGEAGALGLVDDAALLDVPAGHQLTVTTDALVAGVHFLESLPPEDIAYKVVGANLSDLAAMGATPKWAFLAAQFPSATDETWIARFAQGLGAALAAGGAALAGGDTVRTPGPLAFTLTALGCVAEGRALTRSGAREGDGLYVTGTIGDGALGLLCHTGELPADAYLQDRYARPRPRNAFAAKLAAGELAHACVDISDGLAADVGHICAASNVGAVLEAALVPLSGSAERVVAADPERIASVLSGGDDYELAFAADPQRDADIQALAAEEGLAVTRIGRFAAGAGVRVIDGAGRAMDLGPGGYVHL